MESCTAGRGILVRRLAAVLVVTAAVVSVTTLGAAAAAGELQQPEQQAEWQRVTPETAALQEQLPATPFVLYAYGFVWVATLAYLWSIWRRINRLRREMEQLERRVSPGGRR